MKKKLRFSSVLLSSILGASLFFLGGTVSAAENIAENKISESALDEWMMESGASSELINRWGYDQKLSLYEESGDKVEFVTSKVVDIYRDENNNFVTLEELKEEQNEGEFSTMATIPPEDLQVSHDIVRTYDGSSEERYTFYANYEWQTTHTRSYLNGSVENDKIGIALPSGWDIVAGSDECKEFQNGTGPGPGTQHGTCGGGLYEVNYYGYAWSLTGDDDVWHSGWVSLKADRVSSSASIQAISQYAQAPSASTSISANWGPLTISFSSAGDLNKRSWHTER